MKSPLIAAAEDISAGISHLTVRERGVCWAALLTPALRTSSADPDIQAAAEHVPELPLLIADVEPAGWTGKCMDALRGLALVAGIEPSAAEIAAALDVDEATVATWLSLPPQHEPMPWWAWKSLWERALARMSSLAAMGVL